MTSASPVQVCGMGTRGAGWALTSGIKLNGKSLSKFLPDCLSSFDIVLTRTRIPTVQAEGSRLLCFFLKRQNTFFFIWPMML